MKKSFLMANYFIFVIILLLAYSAIAFTSVMDKSVTFDEIAYVSVGYNLIKTGEYSLNVEQPPLAKILAGAPLLEVSPSIPANKTDEWRFSHDFFFASGNDPDKMLMLSRIPFILIGVILGVYLFLFARKLYGLKAGLLALILYCFEPSIIALSQIAITDFLVAAFLFISIFYLHEYFSYRKVVALVLSGLFYGLAFASKFTAIYLLPAYFIIPLILQLRKSSRPLKDTIKKKWFISGIFGDMVSVGISMGVALFAVLIAYGFNIDFIGKGLSYVIASSSIGRWSYLLGSHYTGSNLFYYPVAFLVKTSMSFIFILGMYLFARKSIKEEQGDGMYLIVPLLIFLIISLFNKLNIGQRHILVIYPFLFAWAGNLANTKINWQMNAVYLLVSWHVLAAILAFPNYLSYFNEAALGHGEKVLLDSNIDWGQDASILANYIRTNGIQNASISYFGNEDLHYLGIGYSELGCNPVKGTVAISVNNLFGLQESTAACNSWLLHFAPVKILGGSIWIFNADRDLTQDELNNYRTVLANAIAKDIKTNKDMLEGQCMKICQGLCAKNSKKLAASTIANGKCSCSCA